MQWSRVKTILIVLLAAVDCLLLCMLGGKMWFAYQREQEAHAHIQTVLEKSGVTLDESAKIPASAMIPQLLIDRNRADEAAVASALLGGSAERREDGERSRFVGSAGEVVWDEQGELTATLTPEDYTKPQGGQVQERARKLLQSAGFSIEGLLWETDGNMVTVRFKTAGYEVFNQNLTITFAKESVQIQGRWTFGEPYSTKSNLYASYDPNDALLVFAGIGVETCISGMEPGLLLTNTAGNQFGLTPVWRLCTDQGEYFVDAQKRTVLPPEKLAK